MAVIDSSASAVSSIPGTAAIMSASQAAKRAYQNALARLNNARTASMRDWGYQADFDPATGVVKNMRVDPNNPFGQYQGFRREHAYGLQDAEDALIGRGLSAAGGLGAGLVNRLRLGYQGEDQAFANNMLTTLANFQDQQSQAKYEMDAALWQAQQIAAQQAAADGNWGGNYDDPYGDPGDYTPEPDPFGTRAVDSFLSGIDPEAVARALSPKSIQSAVKATFATPKKRPTNRIMATRYIPGGRI